MDHPFFPILIVFAVAAAFAGAFLGISRFLGPHRPLAKKLGVYECGLEPIGSTQERFSVKFYLVAILFLLFDIEAVFLLPWAVLFRDFMTSGVGLFMVLEMATFVVILILGLGYVWKQGALDWK